MNYDFAGDTEAAACLEIIERCLQVNVSNMTGYGKDDLTRQVQEIVQGQFSKKISTLLLSNGSAANVLAIKLMKHDYSQIISLKDGHINDCEVGATEFITGCKILGAEGKNGKLTPADIEKALKNQDLTHSPKLEIAVISQPTEKGLVYSLKEMKALCEYCHKHDIYVYVDGARLANAMAKLNCGLKEMLEETGVDIANFGVNKNGAMFGEMLIILNEKFDKNLILHQKQLFQSFSKSRFLAAQYLAMFENDLWKNNARHSNRMAKILEKRLRSIKITPEFSVQTNAVFVKLKDKQIEKLTKEYAFGYLKKILLDL